MTKKKSEFTDALRELDQKSLEINSRNKVQKRRDQKIYEHELRKEAEKVRLAMEEQKIAKESSRNTFIWIVVSYGGVIAYFIYRRFMNDPVEFWFEVIVVVFYIGLLFQLKYSR